MRTYTIDTLHDLAAEDQGVCLLCGESQDILETRLYLGLCDFCDRHAVIPAETLLLAAGVIDQESEADE